MSGSLFRFFPFSCVNPTTIFDQMTGYKDGITGLTEKAADFLRLRGRLEASPFHFINLGVLAYIGMGQARKHHCTSVNVSPVSFFMNSSE